MLLLRTRKQRITTLAFSPEGMRLAVGGTSKRVDVWNLATTKSRPVYLPQMIRPVAWVGFTPWGVLVVVTDRGAFQLHDPATAVTHAPVTPGLAYLNSAVLSPNGM